MSLREKLKALEELQQVDIEVDGGINADTAKVARGAGADVFVSLHATDEQMDFPVIYASAKEGYAKMEMDHVSGTMEPLFDTIVKHCPMPDGDAHEPLQMLVTLMDYNDFVGQIGIGRIVNGRIKVGDSVGLVKRDGSVQQHRVTQLYGFEGLSRIQLQEATAGEIVALAGS